MASEDKWKHVHNGGGGAVYGLGIIGALIYFLPQAAGLEQIIIGILKSLVWPGFFVYEIFQFLKV